MEPDSTQADLWDVENNDFRPYENSNEVKALRSCFSECPLNNDTAIRHERNYHEVFPNVFISDLYTAKVKHFVLSLGVTHVVNAVDYRFNDGEFLTSLPPYYLNSGIQYLGFRGIDRPNFDMFKYFHKVADFIDEGIMSGGKVLVHCREGISRSSTLVAAYLMMKRCMTVEQALVHLRQSRGIRPNRGFLAQLIYLGQLLRLSYS